MHWRKRPRPERKDLVLGVGILVATVTSVFFDATFPAGNSLLWPLRPAAGDADDPHVWLDPVLFTTGVGALVRGAAAAHRGHGVLGEDFNGDLETRPARS